MTARMHPNMTSRIEDDLHPYPAVFLEELEPFEADVFSPVFRHHLRGSCLLLGISASLLVHATFLAVLMLFHSRMPATREPVPIMVHLVQGGELEARLEECGGENGGGEGKATEEGPHQADPMGSAPISTPEPLPAMTPETPSVPEPVKEEIRRPAKPETTIPKPKPVLKAKPRSLSQPKNPPPVETADISDGKQKSVSEQTGGKTGEAAAASGASGGAEGAGSAGDQSGSRGSSGHGSAGAGVPAGELHLNQVERPPQILRRVEPAYPFAARSRNLTGKVMVKILVSPDGEVTRPSILEASPRGVFEECVLEAVRQWRFKPGYHQGRAVATWIVLPIQFKLTN